jgi:hypothetical protein
MFLKLLSSNVRDSSEKYKHNLATYSICTFEQGELAWRHIVFVIKTNWLLFFFPKFDVNLWLKSASDEKCLRFLDLIVASLYSLSQNPEEQKSIILGVNL